MTTRTLFPVQGPTGETYSSQYQTDASYAGAWSRRLREWRAAKGKGAVHCLCCRARPVPLVLRQRANNNVTLARHPHTGPDHDTACRYFGPSIAGAIARAYETGVVKEVDGLYQVRLAVGRTMHEPRDDVPPGEHRPLRGTSLPRQRAMTALGLLKLLWEIAVLHEYRPAWAAARAKPASVAGLLLAAAESIRWAKSSLANGLQVGSAYKTGRLVEHNRQVAASARKKGTRLVVVGCLRPYDAHARGRPVDLVAGQQIPLDGEECTRPVLSDGHAHGLQHSFNRELQAWRQGATVYAILIVNHRPTTRISTSSRSP